MDVNQIKLEIKFLIFKYRMEDKNASDFLKEKVISQKEYDAIKKFRQNFDPIENKYHNFADSQAGLEIFQEILDEIKYLRKEEG
jgi:hypothetical protein